MAKRATHSDFRKGGFVSLWLGNKLTGEEELDGYLAERFQSDFGFVIYPPDGPEYDVSETPKCIDDLLDGFSRSTTFKEAAVEAANLMGWAEATTAVVFYNFKYDSDNDNATESSPLRFVGVFRFPGFS